MFFLTTMCFICHKAWQIMNSFWKFCCSHSKPPESRPNVLQTLSIRVPELTCNLLHYRKNCKSFPEHTSRRAKCFCKSFAVADSQRLQLCGCVVWILYVLWQWNLHTDERKDRKRKADGRNSLIWKYVWIINKYPDLEWAKSNNIWVHLYQLVVFKISLYTE